MKFLVVLALFGMLVASRANAQVPVTSAYITPTVTKFQPYVDKVSASIGWVNSLGDTVHGTLYCYAHVTNAMTQQMQSVLVFSVGFTDVPSGFYTWNNNSTPVLFRWSQYGPVQFLSVVYVFTLYAQAIGGTNYSVATATQPSPQ